MQERLKHWCLKKKNPTNMYSKSNLYCILELRLHMVSSCICFSFPNSSVFLCFKKPFEDKANPWVYYYATAYRTPEDTEIYHQFVDQDQASTVVKSRKEDRHWDEFVI